LGVGNYGRAMTQGEKDLFKNKCRLMAMRQGENL
jgi:hypothetical protein